MNTKIISILEIIKKLLVIFLISLIITAILKPLIESENGFLVYTVLLTGSSIFFIYNWFKERVLNPDLDLVDKIIAERDPKFGKLKKLVRTNQHNFDTNVRIGNIYFQAAYTSNLYTELKNRLDNIGISRETFNEIMFEKASTYFNNAKRINPISPFPYIFLGAVYYVKNNYYSAQLNFDKARQLNDKALDASFYLMSGQVKSKLNNSKAAIEDFQKAIELSPNFEEAYNYIGFEKINSGEYQEAINRFLKVIEMNPNNSKAYFNMGLAHLRIQDFKSAIKYFNKSIYLNPNNEEAYLNRGIALGSLGNHESAIDDFDRAITINPEYAVSYYSRGVAKNLLNDIEGSIKDYIKAIEVYPGYAEAYYDLAQVRMKTGDLKGAMKDFNKVIEINPSNSNAYYYRGIIKKDIGDLEGSETDLKRANDLKISQTYEIITKN